MLPLHSHGPRQCLLSSSSRGSVWRQALQRQPLHRQHWPNRQASKWPVAAGVQYLTGVRDIPSKYKGVLLDQFGVLHDGKVAYPGAVEAVQHMADQGLKLFILSNSSRRSEGALGKIRKLGFNPDCFVGVMTSGEIAHRRIGSAEGPFWSKLGKKCLHFTWRTRGVVPIAPLDLEVRLPTFTLQAIPCMDVYIDMMT
ncbi:hypothetical protein WJX84_012463 [Apatococcus fuscideae]|uniref:Uncharacterized protein n=1 Tax=Apatococcus fuscideae TaxID=2026836 RepID=A0AAW1S355_9CHLO